MATSPYWQTYPAKSNKKSKKIVLVSGDEEYRSEEALPMLAQILSEYHGFDCQVLFAQDTSALGVVDPNCTTNIMGLENLEDADLMILFTRFRALPNDQMQHFQNYLEAGKPIIGIRTATHAFNFKDTTSNFYHWGNYYKGDKTGWKGGFGQKILGINWHTHHGWHKHQSTKGVFAPNAEDHPVLKGIESGEIWGSTDVYGVRLPLPDDAQPLVLGQVMNRAKEFDKEDLYFGMRATDSEVASENPASRGYNPNEPMMPIIWTKSYQVENGKKGLALTSTIGASSDLMNDELRQMFVNAVYYLLNMEVPENANVTIEAYNPSQYSFKSDEYWKDKNMVIKKTHKK
jgi:hypothetical protein